MIWRTGRFLAGMILGGLAMGASALAAPAASVELTTGRVGAMGHWMVGLGGVFVTPLRARITLWSESAGDHWESSQNVEPGQIVIADGAYFRVRTVAPAEGGQPGRVVFDPLTEAPPHAVPPGAVVLALGGQLRLDGPDVETATDVQISAWQPDAEHPAMVVLETWPAVRDRDHTAPELVRQITLSAGAHATVGRSGISATSLVGAAADHPAWVVLRVTPPN